MAINRLVKAFIWVILLQVCQVRLWVGMYVNAINRLQYKPQPTTKKTRMCCKYLGIYLEPFAAHTGSMILQFGLVITH